LTRAQITILSDRRKFPPYGLQGGEPGALGKSVIVRKDGTEQLLPSKFTGWLDADDIASIQSPGGGGWGKP
jgi:N-methylhydantoinase B